MITTKSKKEIGHLREGGNRLAYIVREVAKKVVPGVTTSELDMYARTLITEGGDEAAFLDYTPEGVKNPYPAALCVSINDEVVHGIPSKKRKVKAGDVVTVDLGLVHAGLYTDHAVTVVAGKKQSKEIKKLLAVTRESMMKGIAAAKAGNHVGDIGFAVETELKKGGLGIVRVLSGHGVGYAVHEDPFVPNYGRPGEGERLIPGMVIAIEPMATLGSGRVRCLSDGYTYVTTDGTLSAHFEHTILITKSGPEILTSL